MMRILLLAGTAEARDLAETLSTWHSIDLVSSLAGSTSQPEPYAGAVQIGGFGGSLGLEDYLHYNGFSAVIDGTHPFAQKMSENARQACASLGLPLLRFERPAWQQGAFLRWTEVADIRSAISALTPPARVLATTGAGSADAIVPGRGVEVFLRAIEPPAVPLKPGVRLLRGRPPFSAQEEATVMRELEITHLLCKNSGGAAGLGKLQAARELGVEVLMIPRPHVRPSAYLARTKAEALTWLSEFVANGPGAAAARA